MSPGMIGILIKGFWQTLEMVIASCLIAVIFGLPLGVLLFTTTRQKILSSPILNKILSLIVNVVRSIPFIILMVAIIPFTRLIVGTSIGTVAAIVPLAVAAIPFVARLIESALQEVSAGLIEAAEAMGATPLQIIYKVLLPEAMSGIVRVVTLTLITLVGYSAMAGVIGGGGLGDVAIQYGYERFEVHVMILTVLILIIIVQLLQWIGDIIANRLAHTK